MHKLSSEKYDCVWVILVSSARSSADEQYDLNSDSGCGNESIFCKDLSTSFNPYPDLPKQWCISSITPKKKRVQGSCTQEIAHINSGLQHTRKSLRALGGVDGSLSLSRWMLSFTLLSPLHVNSDAESFKDRNVSNVDKLEGNKQTALWEDVLPSVWDDKRTSLKSTAAEFKLLLKMRNRSRFTEQILCSHPTHCKGELN